MTINPEQRDALYASIIVRLTGINDVYLAVEEGEFEVADRLSSEFADYLRLLHDDLGWGDRTKSSVELTSPTDVLERALRRLRERAEIEGSEDATERVELQEQETQVRLVQETCDQLLSSLG